MILTEHAVKRMAQRGVRPETVQRVIEFGDQWIFVGKGCASVSLSREYAQKLIKAGEMSPSAAERLANLCVVVANDSDAVVTVVHPENAKAARSYTKAKGYDSRPRRNR
jgi:hypothetical protein